MEDKLTLKLDDVTIHRMEDGIVTITPRRGGRLLSIGLLIACGLTVLLCGGGLVVYGVIQLFSPEGDNPLGYIVFGLLVSAMFGSMGKHLFQQRQTSQKPELITLSPLLNSITIGERVIPFREVESVRTAKARTRVVKMEGVFTARVTLTLTNGEIFDLGSFASERTEMDERANEILALLKTALKQN